MKVFVCACGTRTTEPYQVYGELMCVLCAEEKAPRIVERRIRSEERQYRDIARHDTEMRRWNS